MAQDYAASVQGVCIRASRLSASGAPATGPTASYVMSAFIRTSFTPEYEAGDEITEKAASGALCVSYKAPDTLKRVTMELAICEPDPELTEILSGGTILTGATTGQTATTVSTEAVAGSTTLALAANPGTGVFTVDTAANTESVTIVGVTGTVAPFTATLAGPTTITHAAAVAVTPVAASVGYAAPETGVDSNPNGCGLEVWSYAVQNGRRAAFNPYFRWVFPSVQLKPTGDRVVENGLMANVFSGFGVGNANFGTGPAKNWPYISSRAYQYARDAVAPTGVRGYVTVT